MFDSLSGALQQTFKKLRGYGRLTERNVQEALREVRLALLEADVHFKTARDFTESVRVRCLGAEVLESITPGQQVVKLVQDELTRLLGSAQRSFNLSAQPASVLLLGLHGSGKTTTAGKLAARWVKDGKRVLLAACDIRRPAAAEQLKVLAGRAGADWLGPHPGETVPALGLRARRMAEQQLYDRVIYDTGGRFQMDEELIGELKALSAAVRPGNTVLVLDAAIGQESVQVAEGFHRALGLTGLILTKLDGDARGGAALSVHAVTGCPVLMTGEGEGLEALQPFYPDRMASRILGMGDVISLVEQAQRAFDEKTTGLMERKIKKNRFDLQDFLEQLQQMKKLGPLEKLVELMPGAAQLPAAVKAQMGGAGGQMKRQEAIILSMTPRERRNPEVINFSRRKRIAAGSGTNPGEVNRLLKGFRQAKKMSRKFAGGGLRFDRTMGGK